MSLDESRQDRLPRDSVALDRAHARAIKLSNLKSEEDIPTPAGQDLNAVQATLTDIQHSIAALQGSFNTLQGSFADYRVDVETSITNSHSQLVQVLSAKNINAMSDHFNWVVVPFIDGTMPPADLPPIHGSDDLENLTVVQLNRYLLGHGLQVQPAAPKRVKCTTLAKALGVVNGTVLESISGSS